MSVRESPRRREVLEVLRAATSPLGVAEVAERLGVHPNTVRFHVDALVGSGQLEQRAEKPSGRGRPRAVYAVRPGMDRGGTRGYRLLARMLLSHLASGGPDAQRAARQAGQVWGGHLVDPPPPLPPPTPEKAAVRLTALLDDLGFEPAPQPDGDGGVPERIALRHCPFLELAEEYGQLVCPLHLGLMQGALAGLRAPLEATRLQPFATPDTCLVDLTPAPAR